MDRAHGLSSRLVRIGLVALLALTTGRGAEAESNEDLDRRIQALVEQRERIPLEGPVLAVGFGAWMVSSGISSAATVQYQCWDGDDCSDELRWGLTAGAGALAVMGLISVGLGGSELSKRLRIHRDIAEELCRLRGQQERQARAPEPTWGLGIGWTDDRRELRIAVQY
jgi:hypothetical protein